jgi:hypothetical protein
MEIDLVRTYREPSGEVLTFVDVCVVDGKTVLDCLVNAGIVNQLFGLAVIAARTETVFLASNQPIILRFNGTSGVQTVTISGGVTGGTFPLTYGGFTASGIPWNATAAVVQTALQGLTSVGANNALVTGVAGGPWTVSFVGALALQPIVAMTTSAASLTGGTPAIAVATVDAGSNPSFTITIAAGNALEWADQDGFFANPISVDVTSVSITNNGTSGAKVNLRFGIDAS